MPAAGIGHQKGPNSSPWQCPIDHTLHNPHFKSWTNWAMKFCLIHHIHLTSHQLRASWAYNFFKHLDNNFLQGKRFHNEQEAENAFQEFIESGSVDFYTTGINKLIPLGKHVMVPSFINKDVFQPRYKDLYEIHGLNSEGNGTPLQYSCLENPRDGGAWWAAVYGVAQSWTRLRRLCSSSSAKIHLPEHHDLWIKKWNQPF